MIWITQSRKRGLYISIGLVLVVVEVAAVVGAGVTVVEAVVVDGYGVSCELVRLYGYVYTFVRFPLLMQAL